jgi:hypothetical protein
LPAARDLVAGAVVHRKLIAHVGAARPLFEKAGAADGMDAGFITLEAEADCKAFVAACRAPLLGPRQCRALSARP